MKRDVLQGRLPLPFDVSSELAALAVQCKAECFVVRIQDAMKVVGESWVDTGLCSWHSHFSAASVSISAELGDYDPKRHSQGYISEFRFVPNQTEEFEQRVMFIHRTMT